jgi:hypothetical protein
MRGICGVEALFTEVFKHLFDLEAMGEITQTVLCGEYMGPIIDHVFFVLVHHLHMSVHGTLVGEERGEGINA